MAVGVVFQDRFPCISNNIKIFKTLIETHMVPGVFKFHFGNVYLYDYKPISNFVINLLTLNWFGEVSVCNKSWQ